MAKLAMMKRTLFVCRFLMQLSQMDMYIVHAKELEKWVDHPNLGMSERRTK
jgi:hypothetical protein